MILFGIIRTLGGNKIIKEFKVDSEIFRLEQLEECRDMEKHSLILFGE
jgi:hypothetical protein